MKYVKYLCLVSIIFFVMICFSQTSTLTEPIIVANAGWGDIPDAGDLAVDLFWRLEEPGDENEKTLDTPWYFRFNDKKGLTQKKHYDSLGIKNFYESAYLGKYNVYTWKDPENPKHNFELTSLDHSQILENWQRVYGNGGELFVDAKYNLNLKLCSVPPNDGTNKACTPDKYGQGNMIVQSGPYKGKHYEWRFMGYTYFGTTIQNPFFPSDWSITYKPWEFEEYTDYSWNISGLTPPSPYVYENFDKATLKRWFNDYLFKDPAVGAGFLNRAIQEGYTKDTAWEFWATKAMWQIDPERGAGLLVAWHHYYEPKTDSSGKVIKDANGNTVYQKHYYYRTTLLEGPEKPNIRLVNLKLIDKDTGKVVAEASRSDNGANPPISYNPAGTNSDFDLTPKANVIRGKTYEVQATYKNMPLNFPHETRADLTMLQWFIEADGEIGRKDPKYIDEGLEFSEVQPIPDKGTATFTWDYTINSGINSKLRLTAKVDPIFAESGDNYNLEDDYLKLLLQVAPEDMEMYDAVLLDQFGNQTNDVIPGNLYSVQFIVKKNAGIASVGKAGDARNPFATLNSYYEDGLGRIQLGEIVATETLYPNSTVDVSTGNRISPRGNIIKACATISDKHRTFGQNADTTNDTICKTWSSTLNFAVTEFQASPTSIQRYYGSPAGTESMSFKFRVTYETERNDIAKQVKVVLRQGGTILKQEDVWLSPLTPYYEMNWHVANVPIYFGDVPFEVEINPMPRQHVESLADGTDPYRDNIATTSVNVRQAPEPFECKTQNTYNSWTQTYSVYEWRGYLEEYDCSYDRCLSYSLKTGYYYFAGKIYEYTYQSCDEWEWLEKTCNRCVSTDPPAYDPSPTYSHYESFEITKVLFKSKLTTDTQGGWVDLLTQPDKAGKIKAGYGFELKIETRYSTNRRTAPPYESWSYTCNGKSVSPGYSSVTAPTKISLKLPYTTYILDGTTSGSWDNATTTYQLPYRDAFGLKTVPQIFVNPTAKNGTYPMEIVTQPNFYGSYDKPYTAYLQQCITVYLKVTGGGTDDLKTHIIQ